MRLTCPTCRSVLEVPDGTSALVRCPTCRGVFDPAANSSPPPPPPPVRKPPRAAPPAERPEQRESEPTKSYASAALEREAKLEKERQKIRALKRQLRIAGFGCNLLRISYMFYIASIIWLSLFVIAGEAVRDVPMMYIVSGLLGFANYILGAVAMGFIVAGPNKEQVRVYGIIALVTALAHLMMLMVLVLRPNPITGSASITSLAGVPTQILFVANLANFMIYPNLRTITAFSGFPVVLMVAAGVLEVFRIMFSMLTLMCLSRTAGDNDLGYLCLRAAASPLLVLCWLFALLLGFSAIMIEAGLIVFDGTRSITRTVYVTMWVLLCLMVRLPLRRTVDVMELCRDPTFIDEKYRTH